MNRVRTTHTGSLPRPPQILQAVRVSIASSIAFPVVKCSRTVGEVVRKQVEAGIDIVTDGEMSKPSFFHYLSERLEGFAPREPKVKGRVVGPMDLDGRDAKQFPDYYAGFLEHSPFGNTIRVAPRACVAPIKYAGRKLLERDITNLKRAMAG